MDFEDLRAEWQREAGPAGTQTPREELEAVRARSLKLERVVRRRDSIETIVALALFPIFAYLAVRTPHPVSAVGAAIVAAACVLIPIRLWMARRDDPDPGLPVVRALEAELARIRSQERLLGSVAWWYVAPLATGVLLFMAGAPVSPWFKVIYGVVVLAFFGWLLHVNRRAARTRLEPAAREIERWLAALEEPSFNGASDAH